MILDISFSYYLINSLKIISSSPLFWLLLIPPVLFGSLSFFIIGKKYAFAHRIIIFSYGIMVGMGGINLAQMTGDMLFITTTIFLVCFSNILILGSFIARKINVFVQVFSVVMMYGWFLVYIFKYLP